MNRILVFGMTENLGGVESVIMNYYRKIDKKKIQFDFLCNTDEVAYEDEIKLLGGTIYKITARSKNRKLYKQQMNSFFKENAKKYSAIWVNLCSLANIDYLKFAKKYGIKYRIIHSHNSQNMDSKLRGILHRINKIFIGKYATDFWACGDGAGKWFYNKKIMKSNKYLNITNAIDVNKFSYDEEVRNKYRKDLGIENKLVVGHVGRFHFQKNQEFLIDIFYEFHKKQKDSVLVLIGIGEDFDKIKDKVNFLGLTKSVKFLGMRNDVEKLMQAMDVFLFPSVFEGLGVVLVEAQASNLLVYASKDVIPSVVKIMDERFKFISLSCPAEQWSNEIIKDLDKVKTRKQDTTSSIKMAGYDITTETKKLEKLLSRK